MKSARGIYYDLNESTYIYEFTMGDIFKLYFSSEYLMNKFKDKIDDYIKQLNDKMRSIYFVNINSTLLAIIILYSKIEYRGFKVVINNIEYNGLNEFNLHIR